MSTSIIHLPVPHSAMSFNADAADELDRLITDRAHTYQRAFGLRTERTRDGHTLAMSVGRVIGLLVPSALAHQTRTVLGPRCGPTFTDSGHTWVFLAQHPPTEIELSETILALYRDHSVMTIAQMNQIIPLPTPGDASRSWIQTPDGEILPEFARIVAALDMAACRKDHG